MQRRGLSGREQRRVEEKKSREYWSSFREGPYTEQTGGQTTRQSGHWVPVTDTPVDREDRYRLGRDTDESAVGPSRESWTRFGTSTTRVPLYLCGTSSGTVDGDLSNRPGLNP